MTTEQEENAVAAAAEGNEQARSSEDLGLDVSPHPERMSIQEWIAVITRVGSGPGSADVVTFGPDPELVRAGNFVLMGLSLFDGQNSRVFDRVCVLSPPTWPESVDLRQIVSTGLRAFGLPNPVAEAHIKRVDHHALATLDSEALLEELERCPDRAIVYIPSAADFRYRELTDEKGTRKWGSHLARLTVDAGAIVEGSASYVLLDAGRFTPSDALDRTVFEELDCGYAGFTMTSEAVSRLVAVVVGVADKGSDDHSEAMAAIAEAEDALEPDSATMLRAVALHGARRFLGAWAVLSQRWESLLKSVTDQDTRVDLARIATDGGENAEARRALALFDVNVSDPTLLEKALLVSSACNDRVTEAKVIVRLQTVVPSSTVLATHLVRCCIHRGDYDGLRVLLSGSALSIDEAERKYLNDVVSELSPSDVNFRDAVERLCGLHPERRTVVTLLVGYESARRANYVTALGLATSIPPDSADGRQATELAIELLESVLMLRAEDGSLIFSDDQLAKLIALLAKRVAIDPLNPSLRNDFARALSVEVLGSRGAAILAYLLLKLASKPRIVERQVSEVADDADVREFLDLALKQFRKGTTIVVGTGRLPDSFTKERAMRLVPVLPEVVRRMLNEIQDDSSFQAMTMALHASLLACDRAGDRLMAAALLRMAAVHLASSGWAQAARDMAEHGLSMAGSNPAELRVAWATFSDVYHRTGNIDEALVGALLLTSIEGASLGAEEAWLEGYLLTRLLRDLGLFDAASTVLANAATLFPDPDPIRKVRIESIRLSIEERRFERGPASDVDLLTLMDAFSTNLDDAVHVEDDVLPPLVLLVQLRARATDQGLTIANRTDDVINRAMKLVPPNLRDRIAAYGAPRPSITELETLARGMSKTKYADDVAYDIQHLGLLAKRALARLDKLPMSDALCLLDLLTDRSIVDLDGRALIDPTRAANAVAHLIQDGHDVHVMAFDERDRLVRLTYSPGSAESITIEPGDVFDRDRFSDWKSELPYRYAFMGSDADVRAELVRRSVDGLGISRGPDRSTVFVCDVALQPFPMNLLRHHQDFVGALVPTSSAPSLDWLFDTASRPYLPNGRCVAWVSDSALDVQAESVLGPLADCLEPLLEERDGMLVRAETPPSELKAADVAIVVAHGGLVPEERFFQVLRDDHNRQWAPREIVRAIGGAGVVVLFVCSSGRLDEHPRGRATVGLVRRLLANGCRSVAACPWPLAVTVPPKWLPHFLDSVNAGERISEAVFRANQEMLTLFRGNPSHALAMHFYGDPTFRVKCVSGHVR